MRIVTLALVSASILAATTANASVVYDNGPINGFITAWTIGGSQNVANSFTLASATTVTGFTFGGWSGAGGTFSSVDFGISSSLDMLTTSTVSVTGGAIVPGAGFSGAYDVRDYTASIAPLSLAAGTYYLTLGNAVTSTGFGYWDINNGPSSAYANFNGGPPFSLAGYYGPTSSETFSILAGSAVPEPASWALMLGGFGLVGSALRSRRRTAVTFA